MNSKWKLCFPKTFVSRLARINSDHCPLLLSLVPNLGQIGVKPFISTLFGSTTMGSRILLRKPGKEIVRMCAMLLTCLQTRQKSGIKKFLGTFFGRK